MTDFKAVQLCGFALGYVEADHKLWGKRWMKNGLEIGAYNPLVDDTQAMVLVKRFNVAVYIVDGGVWTAAMPELTYQFKDPDLNRAIVHCVAQFYKERQDAHP